MAILTVHHIIASLCYFFFYFFIFCNVFQRKVSVQKEGSFSRKFVFKSHISQYLAQKGIQVFSLQVGQALPTTLAHVDRINSAIIKHFRTLISKIYVLNDAYLGQITKRDSYFQQAIKNSKGLSLTGLHYYILITLITSIALSHKLTTQAKC